MQFHAVALLHALRATDRLAISKLVTSLVRGSVRSPLAQCLLVRYVAQVSVPPSPITHFPIKDGSHHLWISFLQSQHD